MQAKAIIEELKKTMSKLKPNSKTETELFGEINLLTDNPVEVQLFLLKLRDD